MAVEKCNTTPIEIIRGENGCWTKYVGSKEQLIDAGFADESYFPEGRKRVKYASHDRTETPKNQWWKINKLKGGLFRLHISHECIPQPTPKDARYFSSEIFKDRAIGTLNSFLRVTMNDLSGKYEFSEWGETTIWLEEQSMQDVIAAGARLVEAIRIAKVKCRSKESHLSIVK